MLSLTGEGFKSISRDLMDSPTLAGASGGSLTPRHHPPSLSRCLGTTALHSALGWEQGPRESDLFLTLGRCWDEAVALLRPGCLRAGSLGATLYTKSLLSWREK